MCIRDRLTGGHLAADHPQVAQLAHERVGHGLKDVGGSGLILGAVPVSYTHLLDSSLVCSIAAKKLGKPIRTFAIGMDTDAIDLKYACLLYTSRCV